jgi:DNA (cytosine-5)-methyltransferase 1
VNTGQGFWKESEAAGTIGTSPREVHENNLICAVHGTQDPCTDENLAFALGRNSGQENAVAFSGRTRGDDGRGYGRGEQIFKDGITGPIDTVKPHLVAGPAMAVRRLMPIECARLQGFPDHHTDIRPKGKPTADGPQYKAYGNSWAVPNVTWIGRRIQQALKE